MRIAHTVSSLLNLSAGPTYSVPSLARAQAAAGNEVCLHSLEGVPSFDAEGLKDIRHPSDFRSVPLVGRLGFSRSMRSALCGGRFDIVHTHGLWRIPNTWAPKGAAFVISPRGMLTPVALTFSPKQKRIFQAFFQGRALAAASLYHATAESEYEDIRAFGLNQPVAIIPNGIDLPELGERPARDNRRTVLSLGRIHPKKGLDTLLAAWMHTEAAYPNWSLRIVGPDENGHATQLNKLVSELGLRRVSIEPPVFGTAKVQMMAETDLFVLPSRSENFAMTVAESLAAAVPVISTKGAPWQGLEVHRCGWWTDHGPESLAAALNSALSLPDAERRAMGQCGRRWMENDFSWDRMARMSALAYQWLLNGGDRPDFVKVDKAWSM